MTGSSPDAAPAVEPLLAPREGVPPVTASAAALAEVVARFAAGTGPVAVDAERASGYRYSQRAYLVQLRRKGAGTALVDPIACPDLSGLSDALADVEWVLHAASQDLACLAEVGMVPSAVFDTELAGRLAGFERVGLGAMVENVLGLHLEKGHSAADWSTRPLPEAWLVYAALDVEVLVELRNALEAELRAQGKLAWAHEEFEAVRLAPPPAPRTDPWRRTSGMHRLRSRRQLAAVRALWEARDAMARRRDIAPGRILPDAAIVAAVAAAPSSPEALLEVPVFGGRATRRHVETWYGALQAAAALPEDRLPQPVPPGDGPPPANRWAERDPVAAARLTRARRAVTSLAETLSMPVENLVQPDAVRRLAWQPPAEVDAGSVADALRRCGARSWQVGLVAGPLAEALRAKGPLAEGPVAEGPVAEGPVAEVVLAEVVASAGPAAGEPVAAPPVRAPGRRGPRRATRAQSGPAASAPGA
ncbi:MAG TPA: HRDC domain-containing protein [Mycobacteriales bacterium]|nr:HRDC domain-containing protein [Mycobacteriales bacterium]